MADLSKFSRFVKTERIIVDGQETYGTWNQPNFLSKRPPEGDIGVFRVTSAVEGRPDLISNQVYGTPLFDWVIISFNGVVDTLNWPKAGDTIEYPLDKVVLSELLG